MTLGDWLHERLFERRIVMVSGRLEHETSARAAAALLALDARGAEPIELHLDSGDGVLGAVFALIDTADTLRSDLRILCRGRVGGPVIGVLAITGRRAAVPHTRFHLFQPTGGFTGDPRAIAIQNREQQDSLWRLCGRLARRTGQPAEEIAEDMRRRRHLDAEEALDYGLIDEIISPR